MAGDSREQEWGTQRSETEKVGKPVQGRVIQLVTAVDSGLKPSGALGGGSRMHLGLIPMRGGRGGHCWPCQQPSPISPGSCCRGPDHVATCGSQAGAGHLAGEGNTQLGRQVFAADGCRNGGRQRGCEMRLKTCDISSY